MKAKEVIKIGRNLSFTAANVDSMIGIPRSTLSLANSTIRIAFFADNTNQCNHPDLRIYIIHQARY